MKQGMYKKLFLALFISFLVMYTVMFLNVDAIDHIYLSLTRFYMALLMVSPMAILMLVVMGSMYPDKKKNKLISLGAAVVFVLALVCLRQQVFISDAQYMRAMIPHHSSAILTSRHAAIKDPQVKQLPEGIIASQQREIQEMKQMLEKQ